MDDFLSYKPNIRTVHQRILDETNRIDEMCKDGKKHQPLITSYENNFSSFYLYLTTNCPLRCPFCFAEGGTKIKKELSAEKLIDIIKEVIDLGFKKIVLSGGEPLVYHDLDNLLDLLEKIDKKGVHLVLRSSLSLNIEDKLIEKISKVFDEIVVSVDGDEDTHDSIRGKGVYKIATSQIDKFINMDNCRVGISSVMDFDELNGVPGNSIKEFCDKRNIDSLVIKSPLPLGRGCNYCGEGYEWRKIPKMLKDFNITPKFSCGLGHNLSMNPDGILYPCHALENDEHYLGDLSKESLHDVLSRKEILKLMNIGVDTIPKCSKCDIRYFCGGMCRAFHKDINDDIPCEMQYDKIKKRINVIKES